MTAVEEPQTLFIYPPVDLASPVIEVKIFTNWKKRQTKDFEAKYHKVKAKLAFLSSSASTLSSSSGKNKRLIAETYDWDDEEVSSDENEVTEVKALMALTDEERVSVGKESARNDDWTKISMKKGVVMT
nr:retrovirus-related Pol polyprotein from transposon TNT 1-94 [Tanacetum cinerariifolium]